MEFIHKTAKSSQLPAQVCSSAQIHDGGDDNPSHKERDMKYRGKHPELFVKANAMPVDMTVRIIHNIRAKLKALMGLVGSEVNIGTAVTT